MAFVNEFVPEEEKGRFDPNVYFDPYTSNKDPIRPFRWTIDRDRQVFIIFIGGGGLADTSDEMGMPEVFAMEWAGKIVKFHAYQSASGNPENGWEIDWRVFDVEIPPELESSRDEVLSLLREGLDAMGDSGCMKSDKILAVNVDVR